MSAPLKLVSIVVGLMALITAIAMLQEGSTIRDVARVLAAVLGMFGMMIFIVAQFTPDRQPVDIEKPPTQGKSHAQITVFGLLAAVTFVVSLQQLVNPVQSTDRTFGIVGLIIALFIAFLAFRAYRKMKTEPTTTDAEPQTELGSPKAVLIGIIIFAALFIAGNTRRIMSGRSNEVWIGVGQSAIWLPIFGYFGYREYRKMKNH